MPTQRPTMQISTSTTALERAAFTEWKKQLNIEKSTNPDVGAGRNATTSSARHGASSSEYIAISYLFYGLIKYIIYQI